MGRFEVLESLMVIGRSVWCDGGNDMQMEMVLYQLVSMIFDCATAMTSVSRWSWSLAD